MLAFLVVIFFKIVSNECINILRSKKIGKMFLWFLFLLIIFVFPVLFSVAGKVYDKIYIYYGDGLKFFDVVNVFALFVLVFLVFRRWDFRVWGVLLFLPFVIVLGGSRVNVMAVSFAFYFFIVYRKMASPFVLLMLFYFVFKSYFYVSSIVLHGDGFV
ncbi:hypothetical protein BG841_00870 [Marinobacter sp. X15-166B]|nr:hypothetical protein BG841_00870 [Marinobacter sp. X15-166B]